MTTAEPPASLRVLQISDLYPPTLGGLELQVQLLSRELARRGHEVTVATGLLPSTDRFEVDSGVKIHRIEGWSRLLRPSYKRADRPFQPPVPDPGIVRALRCITRESRPHVVHAHGWMLASFLPLKRASAAKVVVWLHDYTLLCPKTTYLHDGQPCSGPRLGKCVVCAAEQYGTPRAAALSVGLSGLRSRYHKVDRFVANSPIVGREFATALGMNADDIEVVTPSLPAEAFSGKRVARPSFVPSDDYVLFVGALGPHKGVDVLLRAYADLRDAPPLVMLGTRRADTPNSIPAGVSVIENVPHEQVLAAWSHALFGVIPSTVREAFGLTALEAMAAGRAVVASSIGGLPDLVEDGVTGILVAPGDVDGLRHAIDRLVRHPDEREKLGRAARQRALQYTPDRLVSRMERIYRSVLGAEEPSHD
jgi:glycosyltransferase involved in cell wall biosynthesis